MENNQIYRPLLRAPYKKVALKIAGKLSETSMNDFNDLDVCRLALRELWERAFPNDPFPEDAGVLLKRYDKDPGVVQSS